VIKNYEDSKYRRVDGLMASPDSSTDLSMQKVGPDPIPSQRREYQYSSGPETFWDRQAMDVPPMPKFEMSFKEWFKNHR
jgi:hypothetical protein